MPKLESDLLQSLERKKKGEGKEGAMARDVH